MWEISVADASSAVKVFAPLAVANSTDAKTADAAASKTLRTFNFLFMQLAYAIAVEINRVYNLPQYRRYNFNAAGFFAE